MNILYLCDEYPPGRHGGIGTSVQVLARQMARSGHNVVVAGFYDWGYGGKDEETDNGVKVYRFRRSLDSKWFTNKNSLRVRGTYKLFRMLGVFQADIDRSMPRYRRFLETLIKKYNIEIVEAPDFNEYVQFCTRYTPFPRLSAPTVIKLNGSLTYFLTEEKKPVPEHFRKMDANTLAQSDAVASVSRYTGEKTKICLDYKKEIVVIPNGIDVPQHVPDTKKDEHMVIFTGSLVAKKGIYQLVKAWNLVNQKLPDAKLFVYGKGPVEKIRENLNNEAGNTVFFKGHVSREELFKQIAMAAVAIFPSYAEAFALAPLEAIAYKTAVINSNRTSGPELVDDGLNGLLVDPDNEQEIADKILYMLEHPNVCKDLSDKALIKLKERFDIKVVAKENISFYQQVIDQLRTAN